MKNTITQIAKNVAKVVSVTVNELEAILIACTVSTVANIIYVVDDSRSKTVKGIKQVQKRVQISHVYLNHNYTNKVQNLTDEKFEAKPLEDFGKTRISSTIIQSLKSGAKMIDGKVLKSESSTILGYFHNGEEITEANAIAEELWANSYFNPTPKKTMGRGTVSIEDDFGIINTYLERIETIKLQGVTYKVIN